MNEITKLHVAFKKKLSLTKQKLELAKISEENQRILKRIQEVPPAYNHLEWEEEAKSTSLTVSLILSLRT